MHSDVSLSRLKQFPRLMWILLIGSFFTRGSYYMVWPFLAVILYQQFGLSATKVGMILSLAAVVSVLISFVSSSLSDRFGRHKMMYTSGVLYVISFTLLANVNTVAGYVTVITLCSIATSMWRPLVSALIGDIIDDAKTRELAMQSLYFIINVGCAIGPMLGVWFGVTGEQSSFYITAVAFLIMLVLLVWGFKDHHKTSIALQAEKTASENAVKSENNNAPSTLTVLLQDRLLQCLILANIICMFIYAQMDSSLIQYLTRAQVPDLLQLISSLIFTNALIIISMQFILLRMMSAMSLVARIQTGLVLLMVSQFWLAINPLTLFWGWIGAIVVMSLAETILFPTMNVHIDRLAPAKLRGAYFGAANLYEFGFAFAPLGGGLILDNFGGFWLFIGVGALTTVVMYLYHILERLPRPDLAQFNTSAVKQDA